MGFPTPVDSIAKFSQKRTEHLRILNKYQKCGNLTPGGYNDDQLGDELENCPLDHISRFPHRRQFPATDWWVVAGQLVERRTKDRSC
jgi:hypothetical protein